MFSDSDMDLSMAFNVFARQARDEVFRELKALLEPFGIATFCTDDRGSYWRNIPLAGTR